MNFEKSDLRLLKKYFSRRLKTVLGAAFLIVGIAALIVGIFVRNGGPIGLPVGALCVIAAIILFSGGVSDGAFDETLEKYALVPDKVTCAFDLKVKPAHAGKDGKIRSARYYITSCKKADEENKLILSVRYVDILAGIVNDSAYTVRKDDLSLVEESVRAAGSSKRRPYLTCPSFPSPIPVGYEIESCLE